MVRSKVRLPNKNKGIALAVFNLRLRPLPSFACYVSQANLGFDELVSRVIGDYLARFGEDF